MKKALLPHQSLFDELQIALLPIKQELPRAQSMLRWARTTLDREELPTCLAYEHPRERLTLLRKALQEMHMPLKELMSHILAFSPFGSVKQALIALHTSYLQIPIIDTELHLLHLGHDLFEDRETLLKLLLFTDQLMRLQEASLQLKKALLDELLHHLSVSFPSILQENQ